jgi:hypothetical protein
MEGKAGCFSHDWNKPYLQFKIPRAAREGTGTRQMRVDLGESHTA